MRRRSKVLLSAGAVLTLVAMRAAVEPREHAAPFQGFEAGAKERLRVELPPERRDVKELPRLVANRRVVLVGEVHLKNEPQRLLMDLVEGLGDSETVLLLELSKKSQPAIDRYMATGDEASLASVFAQRGNLPLWSVLRRARAMNGRVTLVVAMDENQSTIALNRLFLTDTRNRTMAEAIVDAYRRHPKARIVAYGGQMHMLLSGRYRYDDESRVPAGARVLRLGVPRSDVYSVILAGRGEFPLDAVWTEPGLVTTSGKPGELPYQYFIDYPVFRERVARPLFDAFVNLGELTRVPERG